jgi:hypothetical protein
MRAVWIWLAVLVAALPASAQYVIKVGDEFQVNTYTDSGQTNPAVTMTDIGDIVVVWSSDGSSGSDTSRTSILGQRFSAEGGFLGTEFEVNTYTSSYQVLPAVATASNGGFVVVWSSNGSPASDNSLYSVQARRFGVDGLPVDDQFQVNTYTSNQQSFPVVAANSGGEFLVVWHSSGSFGNDSSGRSIQGQHFDVDGIPVGTQFQINSLTSSDQADPALAMADDGSFVVVWMSTAGSDGDGRSIQGQRFDSQGAAIGDEFQVNTYFTGHQYNPAVTTLPGGEFVVAWSSNGSSGTDSDYAILAQRFSSFGLPLGDEMQVNSWTTTFQTMPSVAADPSGNFTVLWRSGNEIETGPDGDLAGISRQTYLPDGTPVGVELVMNSYTTSYQSAPEIADGPQRTFVATWQSDGGVETDRDLAIEAQRLDASAMFADDFESSDTSNWSATVGL